MRGLINDLLDAGRIETGTLSVSPEAAEVAGARGAGPEDVPERRRGRRAPRAHRPAAGPAAGDGRRRTHRAGPEQPPRQRRPALPGVIPHPDLGGAGRRARRDLGLKRGPGGAARAVAASVPEARRRPGRRRGGRGPGRLRPGPGHLQGSGRGPRGPHPGRERGDRPGHPGSRSRCRRRKRRWRGAGAVPGRFPSAQGPPGPAAGEAHPRSRRRPPDAALRAGSPRRRGPMSRS